MTPHKIGGRTREEWRESYTNTGNAGRASYFVLLLAAAFSAEEPGRKIQMLQADLATARGAAAGAEIRAAAAEERVQRLEEALRQIAEGNLGDYPWQADYIKIRNVARAALTTPGEEGR